MCCCCCRLTSAICARSANTPGILFLWPISCGPRRCFFYRVNRTTLTCYYSPCRGGGRARDAPILVTSKSFFSHSTRLYLLRLSLSPIFIIKYEWLSIMAAVEPKLILEPPLSCPFGTKERSAPHVNCKGKVHPRAIDPLLLLLCLSFNFASRVKQEKEENKNEINAPRRGERFVIG